VDVVDCEENKYEYAKDPECIGRSRRKKRGQSTLQAAIFFRERLLSTSQHYFAIFSTAATAVEKIFIQIWISHHLPDVGSKKCNVGKDVFPQN
jgi:hypothetical protein